MSDRGAPLRRDELASRTTEILSRGGWGNPDVRLVRLEDGPVVVKDFAPRPAWVRWTIGWWLTRRELRAYRALSGLAAVPRLLGRVDGLAFATEYRPGRPLGRGLAGELPSDFLDALRAAVAEMHGRGVVHLDLRHRSNVLAGDDGRPVLLDFASSLCIGNRSSWRRRLVRWLGCFDRLALRKWEEKLGAP
ncbi:MAG: hypothetical protein ACQGVK_05045 [Myxococcota bacterium]